MISKTVLRALQSNQKLLTRKLSSKNDLIQLSVNEKTGITTGTLNRPPVNSLNLKLLSAISSTLTQLEKEKCKGLILTSSSNTVFSAGLDLTALYQTTAEELKTFWSTLQDVWIKLYGSTFPTVAAINGHAPAGGCLLSMSCEYRVMLNDFTIGLNETQFGLVPPSWFTDTLRNTVGPRHAEFAAISGSLYATKDALKIGMIDEIAENSDDLLVKSNKFLAKYAKLPSFSRVMAKKMIRQPTIEKLIKQRDADVNNFVNAALQPHIQKALGLYLASLRSKSAQK